MSSHAERLIRKLLSEAGITIDGDKPCDITVHDPALYARVVSRGSLGLGESYMDGWWDANQLDAFITTLLSYDKLESTLRRQWPIILSTIISHTFNLQTPERAIRSGQRHYDIGNDLYSAMLDTRMLYTCAYWKDAVTLDGAQEDKLDLVCRKIGLRAGQRILDIGCGWGGFARFAAEKYGARVVGITVSKEQVALAQQRCKGLPVEIRLQDYRDVNERFDHIISLGMFEHVGYKNYRSYFEVAHRCLKDGGLMLLHTIASNISLTITDPWLDRYIFPNSMLPSISHIGKAIERLFVMEDWHNFGAYYDRTLMEWNKNFQAHWEELKPKYGDRFKRMWEYYLLTCAGSFRARQNQLWQIVLSKKGVPGGYISIR